VLGVEPLASDVRADADLAPAIARLAERVRVTPRMIERVAVSVGPGGYTSTRIAVAAGAAIALASGAEAVAVPSLRVAARAAEGPCLIALASKRDTAWVGAFDARGGPVPPGALSPDPDTPDGGRLLDAEGLRVFVRGLVPKPATLWNDGFAPPGFVEVARELGIAVHPPRLDAEACLRASAYEPGIDPARLRPIYPREPEAVRKWRELGRD